MNIKKVKKFWIGMINSILRKRLFTSLILLFITYLMFRYDFFLIFFLMVLGITSLIEFLKLLKKLLKTVF